MTPNRANRSSVYLDYNATAPVRLEARDAMLSVLAQPANPSSVHSHGRTARGTVEKAREAVARLLGAETANVTFTSGGTEANVTALSPLYTVAGVSTEIERLFVSAVEHPSVLSGGGFEPDDVIAIPVDDQGRVQTGALSDLLDARGLEQGKFLVSIMAANNETGVIQPISELSEIVSARGGIFHVDAVQAVGKMDFSLAETRANLVSISGHKFGGPSGVGALIRSNDDIKPVPLLKGGGQESRLRSGTENVLAIAGLAAAVEALEGLAEERSRFRMLQKRLELGLTTISGDTTVFGQAADRLSNTTCFSVPGVQAETALINLDLIGISLSSGSACSSGKVAASHVLAAMGVEKVLASGALRISVGWASTEDDIDRFLEAWEGIIRRIRK